MNAQERKQQWIIDAAEEIAKPGSGCWHTPDDGIADLLPVPIARIIAKHAGAASLPQATGTDEPPEVQAEQIRWQDAIYEKLKKSVGPENDWMIDGGGTDSGDPLDFTLAEIGQGLGFWREKAEAARATTGKADDAPTPPVPTVFRY